MNAPQYPVNLSLADRRCLVVGGGRVAVRKVEGLLACGAVVTVVAPRVAEEIRRLPGVTVEERPYRSRDIDGCWLAIAATDRPEVNAAVHRDGEGAGVWVNGADDPEHSSFTLASVVRRGPLTVAVSTSGRSPALAVWLRQRLEAELGPEYEVLVDLLAAERDRVREAGRSTEGLGWHNALDSDMLDLIRTGDLDTARARLQACLQADGTEAAPAPAAGRAE